MEDPSPVTGLRSVPPDPNCSQASKKLERTVTLGNNAIGKPTKLHNNTSSRVLMAAIAYSLHKATTGSRRMARRAGTKQASKCDRNQQEGNARAENIFSSPSVNTM